LFIRPLLGLDREADQQQEQGQAFDHGKISTDGCKDHGPEK
jgi:hypothetical protein